MENIIKEEIYLNYDLDIITIELIRDFIGTLFHVKTHDKDYVFKLYQEDTEIDVLNIVNILDYLQDFDIHTPKIYKTTSKSLLINIYNRPGVLMEYVKGREINKVKGKELILNSYRKLKSAMKDYQGHIPHLGFDFYVGRYLNHLKSIQYNKERIKELYDIGQSLFNQVSQLEKGFMHGDFHTGNMILSEDKKLFLLDFDACSDLSLYIDLTIIFDQTNFNHFNKEDVYKTKNVLAQIEDLKDVSLKSLMAFIPLRHYELIATINHARGSNDINHDFYDEQYHWIKSFYKTWQALFNKVI